jgi:hypothetical protein
VRRSWRRGGAALVAAALIFVAGCPGSRSRAAADPEPVAVPAEVEIDWIDAGAE